MFMIFPAAAINFFYYRKYWKNSKKFIELSRLSFLAFGTFGIFLTRAGI